MPPYSLNFPDIDPTTLPVGLLVPGPDYNLYVVAQNLTWQLYKKSRPSMILVTADSDREVATLNDSNYCEVVEAFDYPTLNDVEVPSIYANIDIAPNHSAFNDVPLDAKRGRGRPRKVIKPQHANRYGRAPTKYNAFLKEEMAKLTHIMDTRKKMRLIADLWKKHISREKQLDLHIYNKQEGLHTNNEIRSDLEAANNPIL